MGVPDQRRQVGGRVTQQRSRFPAAEAAAAEYLGVSSSRPPLGAEVFLQRRDVPWLDAEVIGYAESAVLVSLLGDAADLGAVPVPVTLLWSTGRGLFRAPAEAAGGRDGCRVTLTAPARRVQRRAYPRRSMGSPMTLAHAGGTSRGTLVDISEAALRARVRSRPAGGFSPGEAVRAAFTLHRTSFMLSGTVLREQPGPESEDEPDAVDVVVTLDIPPRTANHLRRTVVFEQWARERGEHEPS